MNESKDIRIGVLVRARHPTPSGWHGVGRVISRWPSSSPRRSDLLVLRPITERERMGLFEREIVCRADNAFQAESTS